MTNADLRVRLRDLQGQLSSINSDVEQSGQVDKHTIDALGDLVTDIEKFVDKSNEATEGVEVADEQQDLRDRILKFGNEHPRVSQFLTQTTDLLAMMGI